ncbi:8798_t:CDS:2, partial [Cetraspora pellucida]
KNKLEAEYEEEIEELTEKIINDIEIKVCIDSDCDDMSFMMMKKAKKLGLKVKSVKEDEYCMDVGGQSKIEGYQAEINFKTEYLKLTYNDKTVK